MPTAVGARGARVYNGPGTHHSALSQSLRLGNQSISGDSRESVAKLLRLTRSRLWFGMETSTFTRSQRSSFAHNFKSEFLLLLCSYAVRVCITWAVAFSKYFKYGKRLLLK